MSDLISFSAYARHRKVDPKTVLKAKDRGKLDKSLVRDAGGKPIGVVSMEAADQEWAEKSDYTDAPHMAEGAMAEAATAQKYWQAKLAELKFREASKELIPARDVEERLTDTFSRCKVKLLALPTRAKQQDPGLTNEQITLLDTLVREALEDLSNG